MLLLLSTSTYALVLNLQNTTGSQPRLVEVLVAIVLPLYIGSKLFT